MVTASLNSGADIDSVMKFEAISAISRAALWRSVISFMTMNLVRFVSGRLFGVLLKAVRPAFWID